MISANGTAPRVTASNLARLRGKWNAAYSLGDAEALHLALVEVGGTLAEAGMALPDVLREVASWKPERIRLNEWEERNLREGFDRHAPEEPDEPGGAVELDEFIRTVDPEPDEVVPGVIAHSDRVFLTGAEGLGKSTLFRQVAVMAASGLHPFGGDDGYRPARVLLVDLENSEQQVREEVGPLRDVAGDRYRSDHRSGLQVAVRPEGIDLLTERDRAWLAETVGAYGPSPDLVLIGPMYKLVGGDPNAEEPAREVARYLDGLRTAHGFALFMEGHAPHGKTRPYGASLWRRWPEVGLHMARVSSTAVALKPWRGARVQRAWPSLLVRSSPWPWAVCGDGDADNALGAALGIDGDRLTEAMARVERVVTTAPGLTKRALRDEAGLSRHLVDRAVDSLIAERRIRLVVKGQAHRHYPVEGVAPVVAEV